MSAKHPGRFRPGPYPVAEDSWQFCAWRGAQRRTIRARATGEYRAPRRGEWFLSGDPVEAYYAPNDLGTPYHIAELMQLAVVVVPLKRGP